MRSHYVLVSRTNAGYLYHKELHPKTTQKYRRPQPGNFHSLVCALVFILVRSFGTYALNPCSKPKYSANLNGI